MGIKVKVDQALMRHLQEKLKELGRPIDKTEGERIGSGIVKAMKKLMKASTSPITGQKFPPLKKEYKERKQKAGLPGVPNLLYSGEFYDALDYRLRTTLKGTMIEVGYYDKKNADKEKGHREGHNGQAVRPTIPEPKKGEGFVKEIAQVYLTIVDKAISRIARRKT